MTPRQLLFLGIYYFSVLLDLFLAILALTITFDSVQIPLAPWLVDQMISNPDERFLLKAVIYLILLIGPPISVYLRKILKERPLDPKKKKSKKGKKRQ